MNGAARIAAPLGAHRQGRRERLGDPKVISFSYGRWQRGLGRFEQQWFCQKQRAKATAR